MDWIVSNIVWDGDATRLPKTMFVSWQNGCATKSDAIDFVAAWHGDIILSCIASEE